MAETSFPFASVSGDRKYKASDWARYFAAVLTNGVFPSGTQLQVSAAAGMNISISAGLAWINGYGYVNDTAFTLPIAIADGVLSRSDRIVIQWQRTNRQIKAVVKTGAPASTPVAPSLVRDADFWELCLAVISVPAGITAITSAHITDTRLDPTVCGIVSSLITPDTSGWYDAWEAEWLAWFDGVRDTVTDDAATNLYNLITDKADASVERTATLTAAGWVGTSAPYTQAVTVTGLSATSKGTVGVAQSATAAQRLAARDAIISITGQAAGTITVVADGEKPTVDVPIIVLEVG